ncbi:SLAM family member 8-like [Puntigrus tetrazona]|uniref:SLAM family member 8-like n=1 Tax=Puntigrus tetrazona TaxID=1606681 RepID=UPI001C88ED4F|nr:SLAM family member 8-like [Puntigrus tetrazona]
MAGVFGVDSVKSVLEGDSVTLNSNLTQIKSDDVVMWKYENILMAKINGKDKKSRVYNESAEGRFRGRLKLDQTGSLIITNTRTTDSGLYKVSSKNSGINIFRLTVYAHLPVPVIIGDSSQNSSSSSSSSCSLLCSAVNVGHVTLSWYKGNSLLSSIGVSDLSTILALHLECLDDSYSCVVNNPIRNQTTHLNHTELCHPCSDCIHCCGSTEAVIRLALSALVGVATVAVLVYEVFNKREDNRHCCVFGADEVKTVSARKGESVTLNSGVTEAHKYFLIQWTFGSTRIAEVNRFKQTNSTYGGPDERFRDRLMLDQTGSLTVTDTRTADSGLYKLTIVNRDTIYISYNVGL